MAPEASSPWRERGSTPEMLRVVSRYLQSMTDKSWWINTQFPLNFNVLKSIVELFKHY